MSECMHDWRTGLVIRGYGRYWKCAKCGEMLGTLPPPTKDEPDATPDMVAHPAHYNSHPSGVECIDIAEHYGFNVGNALKYLWRAGLKGGALEDLRKAAFCIQREIDKRTREGDQ